MARHAGIQTVAEQVVEGATWPDRIWIEGDVMCVCVCVCVM